MSFGRGSATVAYRPIGFAGRMTPTKLTIGMNFGDPGAGLDPAVVEPLPSIPPACDAVRRSVRGRASSTACPRSSCSTSTRRPGVACRISPAATGYAVADPARYVDPASGSVLIRFVNDRDRRRRVPGRRGRHGDDRMSADRPDRRPRQALRPDGRRGRHRPEHRARARSSAWSGRTARARRPRCGCSRRCSGPSAGTRRDRRLVGHPEPRRGPPRPRLHAGRLRGLRRHEGLGVPRLLRPLLRPAGRPAGAG